MTTHITEEHELKRLLDSLQSLKDKMLLKIPESGSRFQFTIRVHDVDEECGELTAHGIHLLNGPMNRAWGVRTASFADPGGHIWEVAQHLSR